MIRAFLGLDLPPGVHSALAVQQFLLPLPRQAKAAQMHLTLVYLGEQPDAVLQATHEAFAALRPAPFDLALRGLGLFGGDRPRAAWAGVAPSAALDHLQAKAAQAARRAGADIPHRRFVPHVTLGRFPPPAAPEAMRLERAIAEGAGFAAGPWRVADMVLWQSTATAAGPRHDELARYPFP